MATRTVVCIAGSGSQAQQMVEALRDAGFANAELSVLFRKPEPTASPSQEDDRVEPAADLHDGLGRKLVGVEVFDVPGTGSVVAAGPLRAAFDAGAMACGIAETLAAMALPLEQARQCAERVGAGAILVAAHAADEDLARRAAETFHGGGAEVVGSGTGAKPAASPEA